MRVKENASKIQVLDRAGQIVTQSSDAEWLGDEDAVKNALGHCGFVLVASGLANARVWP